MRSDPLVPPFAEAVIDLVDSIPEGRVLSYGDVAALVGGGGPRQVGRVMAIYGGATAWWRVIRATGEPAHGLAEEQLARLRAEGAPVVGGRVDMSRARWSGAGLG